MITAARHNSLCVRCVSFSASHGSVLSVPFGAINRSEMIFQGRKSARRCSSRSRQLARVEASSQPGLVFEIWWDEPAGMRHIGNIGDIQSDPGCSRAGQRSESRSLPDETVKMGCL